LRHSRAARRGWPDGNQSTLFFPHFVMFISFYCNIPDIYIYMCVCVCVCVHIFFSSRKPQGFDLSRNLRLERRFSHYHEINHGNSIIARNLFRRSSSIRIPFYSFLSPPFSLFIDAADRCCVPWISLAFIRSETTSRLCILAPTRLWQLPARSENSYRPIIILL